MNFDEDQKKTLKEFLKRCPKKFIETLKKLLKSLGKLWKN